jgi:hypothetical protein
MVQGLCRVVVSAGENHTKNLVKMLKEEGQSREFGTEFLRTVIVSRQSTVDESNTCDFVCCVLCGCSHLNFTYVQNWPKKKKKACNLLEFSV